MNALKRIKPANDDGSSLYRPHCGEVEWIGFVNENPNRRRKVKAQTWFKARELASIVLKTEPEKITVEQIPEKKKRISIFSYPQS